LPNRGDEVESRTELEEIIEGLGNDARDAFLSHLRGGTSSVFLANWLGRAGHPVAASTVEDYRQSLDVGV
jgi:hypothetical protein